MPPLTQATPVATPTGPPASTEPVSGSVVTPGEAYPPTPMGFYTDTTVCIGCKACEVACKEWNGVPDESDGLSGNSYDNSLDLGANRWRHVAFVEQRVEVGGVGTSAPDSWVEEASRQQLVEQGLPVEVAVLLDPFERDAVLARARAVVAERRFPVDGTGRRYPWPLV